MQLSPQTLWQTPPGRRIVPKVRAVPCPAGCTAAANPAAGCQAQTDRHCPAELRGLFHYSPPQRGPLLRPRRSHSRPCPPKWSLLLRLLPWQPACRATEGGHSSTTPFGLLATATQRAGMHTALHLSLGAQQHHSKHTGHHQPSSAVPHALSPATMIAEELRRCWMPSLTSGAASASWQTWPT